MTEILRSPMPYRPDRQPSRVYQQFRFDVADTPRGLILALSGTEQVVVRDPDPDWLTLSATGFASLARDIDRETSGEEEPRRKDPYSLLARRAGTALHVMRELFILYEETLPPRATHIDEAWRQFRENLDIRLPRLLPTTPPHEVKKMRGMLEDAAIVFPRADDHPELVEAGYRYLARKILDRSTREPPLVATRPLPLIDDESPEEPPGPDVLSVVWDTVTAPALRSKVHHLIRWHEDTPQILGRALSWPREGTINGLPELSVIVVAPALRATLFARTDETVRWTNKNGDAELRVTDLKSGSYVHTAPEDSLEETADQAATYLLAIAMTETQCPHQEKLGYPLEYHTDTGVDNPRVLRPEDNVSIPSVALGQYPPHVVDKARRYHSILTDPIAAQAMLGKTEDLLDRIRERRRALKGQTFLRKTSVMKDAIQSGILL